MKIKAVIFDMDGVLIEAKDWHYDALNRALSLFGHEISRYDHLRTFDGLPTNKKLEILSLECGLPEGIHSFINEMKQIYTMEIVHAKCKPRFIHEFALSRLKKNGYKIALASNSISNTVKVMMEKSNLYNYFDFILSSESVIKPKPSPDIYVKAISMLGVSPSECLIVEDNINGIRAAKASGAHVYVVKNTEEVNYFAIRDFISEIEGFAR